MRAIGHWILVILGIIVAVVLLAAGGLAYLVSQIDVRGEIERAVENATGRELTIAGDVGVSYWPVLGVHAANASLANVQGGRAPAIMQVEDLKVGVELPPLLHRQVVVRQLVLQHPRIALELDANGRPNWVLAPRARAPQPAVGAPAQSQRPASPPMIDAARTTLREIQIVDGEASYFDARRGGGWSVGAVNVTTALTGLDQPMRIVGAVQFNDKPINLDMHITRPAAIMASQPAAMTLNVESELVRADFQGQAAPTGELSGAVHAGGPSLRRLAAWLGAPFQGGVGLEQFDIRGQVGFGGGQFAFNDAGFVVDRVSGRGDFTLSERNSKPYLSGRLELFDFDLNPYIAGEAPPAPVAQAPAPAAPATTAPVPAPQQGGAQIAVVRPPDRPVDVTAAPGTTPINFSALHALNADIELVTHAMLVSHMHVDASRATLVVNDGYLAATMESIALYGGTGRGRIEIDARTADARFLQDLTFDGVDTEAFMRDAANFSNIGGRGEIEFLLRTHGSNQRELVANAFGRTHIEVVSGVLHGVDLGGVSRTINNAMRGELIAPEANTAFIGFSGTFAMARGVLASSDISFNTRDLRIPGVGLIDLNERRLDLRISPRSPRGGLAFPFAIRGPFAQIRYTSDIRGVALRDIQGRVRDVQAASAAEAAAAARR